jgi:hypothetical protein
MGISSLKIAPPLDSGDDFKSMCARCSLMVCLTEYILPICHRVTR